jgi:uncharacterized phosphosugar-binding protein
MMQTKWSVNYSNNQISRKRSGARALDQQHIILVNKLNMAKGLV